MHKILWKEGMFLEPHHFQLSERLQTAHADSRINSLVYGGYQYGFTDLEIDRDALLSGNFSILRSSGVFPDGSCFCIGGIDASLPSGASSKALARSFASYCRPDQLTLDVYLAIPADGGAAVGLDDDGMNDEFGDFDHPHHSNHPHHHCYPGAGQRYIERTALIPDDLSLNNNKEIGIGEPNYQIRFEGEPLDDCVSLLAARLSRTGSGYMELKRGHAPPVLFTRCSEALRDCISGLLELLWARIGSLARCRRQTGQGQAFFSAAEAHPFWLLNTLCTHTPLLSRLQELPKIHPFDYYARLTELYGSLLSFSPDISLDKFPQYDHGNPGASFTVLAERIRGALKTEFWTGTAALELERVNASTWACRFPDERFVSGVNLFIGVSAKISPKELLLHVLQRMKVCSREKLDMLVSSSVPGLPLINVKNIPEGLAAKPDYLYFVVDRQSRHWQGVEASGTLGIHFPGEIPEIKLELLALRHEGR